MSVREKGFTLIELMITLVVLGILLLVAVPNFGSFVAQSRVDAVKEKLISSIGLARSEAIKRGAQVVICRRNAGANSCAGTATSGAADWSNGWLVYLDQNADLAIDANGLIRVYADIDDASTITYTRGDVVVYSDLGLLETASTADELFAVGDNADATIGAGLSIIPTGRIRMCSDWNVGAAACND